MAGSSLVVSGERLIGAPADTIFDVLADPRQHSRFDGSGTVQGASPKGPARLSPGARFGMSMRLGVPYRMTNTVVEFEEGRRIGWRHFGGWVWRYELEPRGASTLVRETADYSTSRIPFYVRFTGWVPRAKRYIDATLERLDAYVTNLPTKR
ncbi:MAG: SRPBCC family protein [Acidimicrobiia bacterium]